MRPAWTSEQRQRKIFVLGATGFIGSALVKCLATSGFTNVWGSFRSSTKRAEIFKDVDVSRIRFVRGDLSRLDELRSGLESAAIVVNATGVTTDWGPRDLFWEVHVRAPQIVVGSIADSTHFIHLSGGVIYGFSPGVKRETSPLVESDRLYTASKIEGHIRLRQLQAQVRPPITIITPAIVWGPGDQTFLPTFRDRLARGQMLYWGKHEPLDAVHIDDLVKAILLCFFNPLAYGQEYIINGNEPLPIKSYVDKIAEYAELPPPTVTIPFKIALGMAWGMEIATRLLNLFWARLRPLLTRFQVCLLAKPLKLSSDKAFRELGYTPQVDMLAGLEGLKEHVREAKFVGIDGKYH